MVRLFALHVVSRFQSHSARPLAATLLLASLAPLTAWAAPATVALAPDDGQWRAALDEADFARVVAAMQDTALAERVPGLHARALMGAKDFAGACAVLTDDVKRHPARAQTVALLQARCASAVKDDAAQASAYARVLEQPTLSRDPLVVSEALSVLLTSSSRKKWLEHLAQKNSALSLATPADTIKREAFARFLLDALIAIDAEKAASKSTPALESVHANALRRLYVEFGDTTAGKDALKRKDAAAYAAHKDASLAMERARELARRHDNAALVETLARHPPKSKDNSATACEARYLLGKTQRKMRKYRDARKSLDHVAARCTGEWQKNGRFMVARVASLQGAKDAVAAFDAFVAAYPKDSLSDDVLLWKAEHLALHGNKPGAEKVYEELIAAHPKGDMANTARFDLALARARRGDVAGARAALDALARNAIDSDILVADRALYWRARLAIFPTVDSWDQTSDDAARAEGTQALVSLATARPASFYGHLARLVATTLAPEAVAEIPLPPGRATIAKDATLPVSATLANDPRFVGAQDLIDAGYDEVAALLLDAIDRKPLSVEDALALTAVFARAQAHTESHQVMRERGLALPSGQPSASTLPLWALSFPLAHATAIASAAAATELPEEVLFGLAREESAFDAAIVSWAGAVGLCQLMMFTAKEEAQLLKLPVPSVDDLRRPSLNARLGANHLMRRQSLGHPLLAIAAYNAGPGNVNKWTRRQKGPIDAWVESIPIAQTRGYIVKVTGSWVVYRLLGGHPGPTFSLSLPGTKEPATRALKGTPKVDVKLKNKVKRAAPKG